MKTEFLRFFSDCYVLFFKVISDYYVLRFIHLVLLILFIIAVVKDCIAKRRSRRPVRVGPGVIKDFSFTVQRSEESMNSLYVLYGVITVLLSLAIQVSGVASKVFLIVIDYLLVTYLIFFNMWSRNKVLRALNKIREEESLPLHKITEEDK